MQEKEIEIARELRFVQFPHPGKEHGLPADKARRVKSGTRNVVKEWSLLNYHKRKFMMAKGVAVDANHNVLSASNLYFWGEWEPMSYVTDHFPDGDGVRLPKFLHEPVLILGKDGKPHDKKKKESDDEKVGGCQNTDPFVFGDNFLYSYCRQYIRYNKVEDKKRDKTKPEKDVPTKLQHLQKGSIIVFGSTIGPRSANPMFVVDTVFVVGDMQPYRPINARADLSSYFASKTFLSDYMEIMQFPKILEKPVDGEWFSCYKGRTFADCPEGPFSFVPCKTELPVVNDQRMGFERPVIPLKELDLRYKGEDLIKPMSYRNFSAYEILPQDAPQLWNRVKEIILSQGFSLGVHLEYEREIRP